MKILLVDDDQFFQKFYMNKLLEVGYEVVTASDGEEGMAKFAAEQPQLVLLDLIMPKKDGFDVLTYLQQNNPNKVPVIIFSTLGNDQDLVRAKSLGAVDYVNKSLIDFDLLKEKIGLYT